MNLKTVEKIVYDIPVESYLPGYKVTSVNMDYPTENSFCVHLDKNNDYSGSLIVLVVGYDKSSNKYNTKLQALSSSDIFEFSDIDAISKYADEISRSINNYIKFSKVKETSTDPKNFFKIRAVVTNPRLAGKNTIINAIKAIENTPVDNYLMGYKLISVVQNKTTNLIITVEKDDSVIHIACDYNLGYNQYFVSLQGMSSNVAFPRFVLLGVDDYINAIYLAVNPPQNKTTLNWKIEKQDFVGNNCLVQTASLDNGVKVLIYEKRHQHLDTDSYVVIRSTTYFFEVQITKDSVKNDFTPVKSAVSFATIDGAKRQAELFLKGMGCL